MKGWQIRNNNFLINACRTGIKTTTMKKNLFPAFLAILILASTLSSCEAIGGIFKAGVWVGVIIVVAIIALVLFIISKASGKK